MFKVFLAGKTLNMVGVCVLMSFLVACSTSNRLVKTYDGETLPSSQLATLIAPENIAIISVNGKDVPNYLLSDLNTKYALKPGFNHVVFNYESVWAKPGIRANDGPASEKTESKPMFVSFDARLGEQYDFSFQDATKLKEARALSERFSADLIDGKGAVVTTSKLFEGKLSSEDSLSLVQTLVSSLQAKSSSHDADSAEPSNLSNLKILWQQASPAERKAFLAWAFKE